MLCKPELVEYPTQLAHLGSLIAPYSGVENRQVLRQLIIIYFINIQCILTPYNTGNIQLLKYMDLYYKYFKFYTYIYTHTQVQ